MRMTDAILPRSPPRGSIKGHANHSSPSSHFHTGQQQDKPANITEHTLFLHFLAAGKTSQHEKAHSLFFTDSLTYFEQSTKHHEESSSNLWTIGVWEIILSSFIFPSKPMDPQRNKLDIFNSCPDDSISFDFGILIPAPSFTTVFFFLRLTAQGFLLSQTINKTSKLKTIHIFVNSFVLPFNITRGNRTLQPQLPFLYKW